MERGKREKEGCLSRNHKVINKDREKPLHLYHLSLGKHDLKDSKIAILPGDPGRVPLIARLLDGPKELAYHREYRSFLGRLGKEPIIVTSTGIGGPSTSIAIEELATLGIKTFIRVGTTGAIQKKIKVGDVIITTGSVRLDGASTHYAPIEYPAVANHEVVQALVQASRGLKVPYRVGITASADTFYPGQERYDSFTGYVIKRFQGSTEE